MALGFIKSVAHSISGYFIVDKFKIEKAKHYTEYLIFKIYNKKATVVFVDYHNGLF
jgi:hypothetical protein